MHYCVCGDNKAECAASHKSQQQQNVITFASEAVAHQRLWLCALREENQKQKGQKSFRLACVKAIAQQKPKNKIQTELTSFLRMHIILHYATSALCVLCAAVACRSFRCRTRNTTYMYDVSAVSQLCRCKMWVVVGGDSNHECRSAVLCVSASVVIPALFSFLFGLPLFVR